LRNQSETYSCQNYMTNVGRIGTGKLVYRLLNPLSFVTVIPQDGKMAIGILN
jgi:hypothetical protein